MSSSIHVNDKKKNILIFGEGSTQELDGTSLTAEKMCSIKFTESRERFCLIVHYNGANNYLFVNDTGIHKFKAKDSELVAVPLCLGNISQSLSVDNMKKTGLNGYLYVFDAILIYKDNIFYCNTIFSCNALKCISMNKQKCKIRPQIINICCHIFSL